MGYVHAFSGNGSLSGTQRPLGRSPDRLLVALADAIAPQVRPRYRVDVEQRTYLAVMAPDDWAVGYGQPPIPPLAAEDADWAALLLAQHTTAG